MADLWTLDDLKKWTKGLMATHRVVAPVAGPAGYEWAEVDDPEKVAWEYTKTAVSPREWLIPKHEVLFKYDLRHNPPTLEEPPLEAKPTVILLLRPCDVAGLRSLDAVMRWDYKEEGYEARHAATTLVSLGCNEPASKESCFCESVGLDAHFAKESDVAVERMEGKGGAGYRVIVLTDKGKELTKNAPGKTETTPPEPRRIGTISVDVEKLTGWMKDHFDDPVWQEVSEACLGCGACAYLCPSCHCFDVVDEGDWRRGERVRNWDSCGFSLFTAHATGHNPRPRQWNRYRQRIYHKFLYYPQKFDRLLCTGCGRCVDVCPGGMDLIEVLQTITAKEGSRV
jgi:formate hydrogenlyase subunit 6/NADH:ubiquinone oxidoreductase subunit I